MFVSLIVVGASALAGPASADCQIDAHGVATRVEVGGSVFLTEAAVSLIAPGWQGSLGDQRTLDPGSVTATRQPGEAIYSGILDGKTCRIRLRQVVRPIARGIRIEYELTPESSIAVETVVFRADIPLLPHRGTTKYIASDEEEVVTGAFPLELPSPSYQFLPGRRLDWLAMVAGNGRTLRISAEGMSLALQDDRKFGRETYALLGAAPVTGKLVADNPLRMAVELTAWTAEEAAQAQADAIASTIRGVPLSSRARLRAGQVSLDRAVVPVYERVEMTADVEATFDNPFDPEDVALDAEVTTPDGRTLTLPGFFKVPCRLDTGQRESVRPSGPPCWTLRFTPTVPGKYQALVHVCDRTGKATCPAVTFEAVPSKHPGFVRVAPQSPRYFQFDSGRPYFAVGENVCWAGGSTPIADYAAWFRGLAGVGGNWARLWLATTEKGLEWSPSPTPKAGRGTYLGLGRYSIDNSWRLDEVVDLAQGNGIRLMFCIGTFGELKQDEDYFGANLWVSNPYNSANGGPCAAHGEFFTNPLARKLYQRRLRYVLARWGYSPHVFAWEFWNEYNAPAEWVGEMAAYLKQHDVNRHLVSTTYGDDRVWRLPEVDFTMTHHYGDSGSIVDSSGAIQHDTLVQRTHDKPFFVAEFGIDWRTNDTKYDPQGKGQNLHNGLWAGVMAGGAATPMLWYWDSYVHPKNVYGVFRPVSRFVESIDRGHTRFSPILDPVVTVEDRNPERFTDLDIPMESAWGKTASNRYVVRRDGRIEGGPVASTLGGPQKKELFQQIELELDGPAEGEFSVRLGTVSSWARLQIRVDETLRLDEPLGAGPPGEGPWKSSKHYPQWNIWQADYERDYTVRVPAGKHLLTISNGDGDWLSLRGARVTGYRSSRYPFVRVLGLQSENLVLVWIQDKNSTWKTVRDEIRLEEMVDLRLCVAGMPPGDFDVVEHLHGRGLRAGRGSRRGRDVDSWGPAIQPRYCGRDPPSRPVAAHGSINPLHLDP